MKSDICFDGHSEFSKKTYQITSVETEVFSAFYTRYLIESIRVCGLGFVLYSTRLYTGDFIFCYQSSLTVFAYPYTESSTFPSQYYKMLYSYQEMIYEVIGLFVILQFVSVIK